MSSVIFLILFLSFKAIYKNNEEIIFYKNIAKWINENNIDLTESYVVDPKINFYSNYLFWEKISVKKINDLDYKYLIVPKKFYDKNIKFNNAHKVINSFKLRNKEIIFVKNISPHKNSYD